MKSASSATRFRWRSRLALAVACVSLVTMASTATSSYAGEASDRHGQQTAAVRPGFLQVRTNGELWYYENTGSAFQGYWAGAGWGQTAHVMLLDSTGLFAEVKNGALRLWKLNVASPNHEVTFLGDVMYGWGNARLVAAVGDLDGDGLNDFVSVNTAGQLVAWRRTATGFDHAGVRGYGWTDARQITGSLSRTFVEIKNNGELWSWVVPPGNPAPPAKLAVGSFAMGGWGNVRLLGPDGLASSFVSVRYDAALVQWSLGAQGYTPVFQGWGWGNARLLG